MSLYVMSPGANVIKLFCPQFTNFRNKLPGKPFQPRLTFVGEARSLPLRGAPEISFTWVRSSLICKHQTRLERLARDKHSSLLQKSVNYGQKSLITLAPVPSVISIVIISRVIISIVAVLGCSTMRLRIIIAGPML